MNKTSGSTLDKGQDFFDALPPIAHDSSIPWSQCRMEQDRSQQDESRSGCMQHYCNRLTQTHVHTHVVLIVCTGTVACWGPEPMSAKSYWYCGYFGFSGFRVYVRPACLCMPITHDILLLLWPILCPAHGIGGNNMHWRFAKPVVKHRYVGQTTVPVTTMGWKLPPQEEASSV